MIPSPRGNAISLDLGEAMSSGIDRENDVGSPLSNCILLYLYPLPEERSIYTRVHCTL
jgi:hypothetical protein